MAPTTLFLVRHGDVTCEYDGEGHPLMYGPASHISLLGQAQILRTANRIRRALPVLDAIYTSPFTRTIESSLILASRLGVPTSHIRVVRDLGDDFDPMLMGMRLEDVYAAIRDEPRDPEHDKNLDKRVRGALDHVLRRSREKTIAVVSHGDILRIMKQRIAYPRRRMLPMSELFSFDYLDKGEAWQLELDERLRLVRSELIGRPPELFGKGERFG